MNKYMLTRDISHEETCAGDWEKGQVGDVIYDEESGLIEFNIDTFFPGIQMGFYVEEGDFELIKHPKDLVSPKWGFRQVQIALVELRDKMRWVQFYGDPINPDGEIPWLLELQVGQFAAHYLVYVDSMDDSVSGVMDTVADCAPHMIEYEDFQKDFDEFYRERAIRNEGISIMDDEFDGSQYEACNHYGNNSIPVHETTNWSATWVIKLNFNANEYLLTNEGEYPVE